LSLWRILYTYPTNRTPGFIRRTRKSAEAMVHSNVVACAVVAFSAAGAAAFQAPALGRPQLRSSATSGLRMVQAKEVKREREREGGRERK
jgi:hypothetical protein